ncbi:MAG: hypothetical protein M1839_001878 [Geoglossum umbratile]|nr:MAG: hypothetical protein M1839_001878 [Geoglossum umbratile]
MRERVLETAPADTPTTILSPVARKHGCPSPSWPSKHLHPASRVAKKEFWIAGMRKFPSFMCSPWDFYEPFLELSSCLSLVLCNDGTEVRVMRTFGVTSSGEEAFPLLQIQHPNFVDICEVYLFKDEIFAIVEYVGFSIEDLLQHFIYPTEYEITYIISQVLAGIRFIWSRKLDHPRISTLNILISPKGEVKIDPTLFPEDEEHTSADLNSLGTIMLQMMNETRETLKSTAVDWSAEAIDFIEATSLASPDELSDHVFVSRSRSAKILTPLCILSHFQIADNVAIRPRRRVR